MKTFNELINEKNESLIPDTEFDRISKLLKKDDLTQFESLFKQMKDNASGEIDDVELLMFIYDYTYDLINNKGK